LENILKVVDLRLNNLGILY